MTLEQLTDKPKWDYELLGYYRSHKNEVPPKWKLPISRCLAGSGSFEEAANVAIEYVDVYSNDARGWRIVGAAKLMDKSYDEAIRALTNAIRLGDTYSYKPLGMAAVALTRTNLLRDVVVPHLLKTKDAEGTSKDEELDLALILVAYALEANDREVFVQALNGLTASSIMERGDLPYYVVKGRERFNDKRVKGLCEDVDKLLSERSKETRAKDTNH